MNEPEDRLSAIYAEAIEIPDAKAREAYLASACGTDQSLRQEVEELLQAEAQAGQFLPDQPVSKVAKAVPLGSAAGMAEQTTGSERPGDRIGRYKLLQRIGEGGCGMVYLAEQEEPVHRKVALKVIKLGMDTLSVVARFETERQALALMDHPNIAKVLDAGATRTGRPFFVMELVRGSKITQYCDERKFSTRQRLGLFIQVCQAVQHAHQKGIIHRDIKPSNVLVADHDGVAVPKIIDFGIAKATTNQRLTEKTLFTALEQFLGTPAYMSPEQAQLSGLDIDTRSDIYSLGVLLYELLTGKTPFDAKQLLAAGLEEMKRTIREKEPARPSTRLSTLSAAELVGIANLQRCDGPKLIALLLGDLDWIVMKTLEKDRKRRYETANGLATDIQRYLADEAVAARPPSRIYQFQKLVRRNRLAFTAGAAVTTSVVCGLAFSILSLLGERAARLQAVASEMKARQSLYAADMNLGYQALSGGNLGQVRELVAKYATPTVPDSGIKPGWRDPRGWEWRNLWRHSRGDETAALYGHSNMVTYAGMLLDGRTVVSAGRDQTVRFWDSKTSRLLQTFRNAGEIWSGALSPDGKWLAIGSSGSLSLWDPAARDPKFVSTNSGTIGGVAFSKDSQRMAVASESAVEIWNLKPFSLVRTIARANPDMLTWIAFSPDNKTLAYSQRPEGDATYTLMLCELENGITSVLGTCEVGGSLGLAFSADGRSVISAERSGIFVWDISSHKLVKRLTNHLEQVLSVAVSPDGRLMASASGDQTLRLWDTQTWEELRVLRGHEHEIRSVVFSNDGNKLISCGKDESVRVWDVRQEPTRRDTYRCPPGCVLMPDLPDTSRQLQIQMGTGGPTAIGFFDLRKCELTSTVPSPISLAPNQFPDDVSGDLRRLAILQSDGSIEIWGTMPFARLKVLPQSPVQVKRIALSRSGKLLATEGQNGEIEILDLDQDQLLGHLKGGTHDSDGTGEYYPTLSFWARDTRFARVTCEADEPRPIIEVLLLPGMGSRRLRINHKDYVNNFSVSDDGTLLATTAWDGQIKLWNATSGEEMHAVRGQLVGYTSVAISPDGSRLAAGAWDGSITMWDMLTWNQVAHWKAHARYTNVEVCFSDNGNLLVSRGLLEGQLKNWETRVWSSPTFAEIAAAEKAQAKKQ